MIPTNDLRNFAKYKVIRTVRQSDGATLTATRIVKDIKLPIYWDVEAKYPQQVFSSPVMSWTELPSTSKLVKTAAEQGFGDWYPIPEEMVEIFSIDAAGDDSKAQRAPKYPEPDTTDYIVD
jgi:hypothetical protein